MTSAESFRKKVFVVEDADARIRRDDDLMAFVSDAQGRFRTIPRDSDIKLIELRIAETGSRSSIVFGRATTVDGAEILGWTSTRNLQGKLMNETIGAIHPQPAAGRFGPNAAWSHGEYLGQIELVAIVDSKQEIERLAMDTVQAYAALVAAAANDGIAVTLNSGFRSYTEQKHLHDGFVLGLPGFNMAATPGFSNHQNGIAFDISVAGGDGNPTYGWLKRHATSFGFVRTVNKEPWHWEFDEPKAQAARAAGRFATPKVTA
jgi:hypothetical protein